MLVILKVGWFLALRQIKRSNLWTTISIVFIMMLTFLNLVFVTGILVGLPAGASMSFREQFSSDILVTPLPEKAYINQSQQVLKTIQGFEEVIGTSSRYIASGSAEVNYRDVIRSDELPDQLSAPFVGIDPLKEDEVTGLSKRIIDGEYLFPSDDGYILIGADLVESYSTAPGPETGTIEDVDIGERVRISINGKRKEMKVKGILNSKSGEVDTRVYFVDRELRSLLGRSDLNVDEIAIKLQPNTNVNQIKKQFLLSGIDQFGVVETSREAQGSFLEEIETTFRILGNVIGSIGLVVASITIFIVIFINAITRRKYIGILKAIGISKNSIQLAYIFQAFFYTAIGTSLGVLFLFGILKPYFDANPINFPFSDGILVAEPLDVLIRISLLMIATIIAGYIPARIVVKGNTLDAILGR